MKRYSRVHAEIDLDAILHNMEAMHQCVSDDKMNTIHLF